MTISEPQSTKPLSHNPPPWLAWIFAGVSFVGFLDAGYLAANHYFGIPLVCSLLQGCERVTTSSYALVLGIPVAVLGLVYYLIIFFLSVWYIDSRRFDVLSVLSKLTPIGMAASLWFVAVQLFILRAVCLYCMTSAATSTVLFFLGAYTVGRRWIRTSETV